MSSPKHKFDGVRTVHSISQNQEHELDELRVAARACKALAAAPQPAKAEQWYTDSDAFDADMKILSSTEEAPTHVAALPDEEEDLQADILETARQLELTTAELERVKQQRDSYRATLRLIAGDFLKVNDSQIVAKRAIAKAEGRAS
jgi:hypothetical protein